MQQTGGEAARERQLFEAFVRGDDAALAILFRVYRDRLIRDARRYVPEYLAEDVVQDVFMRLWTRRATSTIRTTVRNYLHSAVRNRARDLLAQARTERTTLDACARASDHRHDGSPEHALLAHELAIAIERGLGTCAARSRAVLLLLQDSPHYAAVAQALGIQPGTVHTLVRRGRRRLRSYLREHGWAELLPPSRPLAVHTTSAGRAHRPSARSCLPVGLRRASGAPPAPSELGFTG